MKIAVTGAGGFLGTELLRLFSKMADVEVYAFSFDFERKRDTYVKSNNIISVDNSEAVDFDYSFVDVLINCAFPRNVNDETFALGLDFIQKIIEKAAGDQVGSVINISSQSVYSQQRTSPADESFPIVLESKYAVGKYWSELFVNTVCRNIRHTNLRLASLIGVGFNQRITNKFVTKVIAGEQITISGGDQLFGFLNVRDAANAIINVATDKGAWEETYNLGTSSTYTLRQIVQIAIQIGRRYGYEASDFICSGEGDWQNSALCCDSFFNRFKWSPAYSLMDTMQEIFKSMQ